MTDQDFLWIQELAQRRGKTFDGCMGLCDYHFDADDGSVPQLQQARKYVQHWKTMQEKNLGLLFWGQPGNGKTFAAACIANALIGDRGPFPSSVRMATFGTILTRLLAFSPQDRERYLQELCSCDLLILDDFGMERQTEYASEQVFHIIDSRYLARKPLIVTTNLSLQSMKNPETLARQRICDRVLQMCVPVYFDGESLRKQKARDNLQLYKQITA